MTTVMTVMMICYGLDSLINKKDAKNRSLPLDLIDLLYRSYVPVGFCHSLVEQWLVRSNIASQPWRSHKADRK